MRRPSSGHSGNETPARAKKRRVFAGFFVFLVGLLLVGLASPAHSQDAARLVAGGLQTKNFPSIHFNLEVYDSQGNFLDGLTPADLSLREDGQPVQAANLTVVELGIQFSVAISPGAQMAQNVGGQPQVELLRKALVDWARSQPAKGSLDFSLSTNTGLQVIRSRDPQQWVAALGDFPADAQRTDVNLFSLTTAMDLASDQTVDPQTKRAILLITPPVPPGQTAGLQSLSARAQQVGVRVFVWVPVTTLSGTPPDTSALQALADATGGRMTLVAGAETIPSLESWLAPLRKSYEVQYLSVVKTGGDHDLAVSLANGAASEQTLRYSLTLAPPNPIFLSPPAKIERSWSAPDGGRDLVLMPVGQPLSIVVEFPDGHTRPLSAARLYLDGSLLAENTSAPFEQFAWDLTPLITSGTHTLRVEVVDSLGLSGTSIETSVEVVVGPKPATTLFERISEQGLIAVGAVLLAGVVLALVLVGENRLRGRRKRGDRRRMEDPVTQPVPIQQAGKTNGGRGRRATGEPGSWPRTVPVQQAVTARLIRVTEEEHPVPGSLIALNRSEITLGSDARQAVVLVEDPSVEKLHARLTRGEDGCFLLTDEHSTAGTWVNYIPVPEGGVRLAHEDLIHLGRVMFRFELSIPPAAQPPAVETLGEQG
ncbi:MAG TPA: FHA domain-containing protein [Anaerolinea sp.]|nr:FHA domain-containing protein [Anaerolinea sp.]